MPEQKSVSVAKIRTVANRMLLESPREAESQRQGVARLLEAVLRDASSYHGYGEFDVDGKGGADYGLRRQYYGTPTEGCTLVRRVMGEAAEGD